MPTTLRARSAGRKRSSSVHRSDGRVPRYRANSPSRSGLRSVSPASSRSGTSSGGSETNFSSPFTRCVSFARARMRSRLYAFASNRRRRRSSLWSRAARSRASIARASSRAYQTSRSPCDPKRRIASRQERTAASTARSRARRESCRSRAAISKLAASRFTSHSNGPGNVSSKSLRSKRRSRSGDAKPPKLSRCASPDSCTVNPAVGVVARSCAITAAAPRKNASGEASMRP
jgi:hypothetical protein